MGKIVKSLSIIEIAFFPVIATIFEASIVQGVQIVSSPMQLAIAQNDLHLMHHRKPVPGIC